MTREDRLATVFSVWQECIRFHRPGKEETESVGLENPADALPPVDQDHLEPFGLVAGGVRPGLTSH